MADVMQRWNFIGPGDRKIGEATPLINTVIGVVKPFTVKSIEVLQDYGQVLYKLRPDVKDDPDLLGGQLLADDDGEMIVIIIVEGGDYVNGR